MGHRLRPMELLTNEETLKSKISSNAASSKQSSKLQSRKQSKHENKRLLPDQQIVHPPQGGAKASKGPKGHQKRSQSNPAIQNHFQQQKFFSRHQSKRPSVQQSPHLQVISLSACLFSPRHLRCKIYWRNNVKWLIFQNLRHSKVNQSYKVINANSLVWKSVRQNS